MSVFEMESSSSSLSLDGDNSNFVDIVPDGTTQRDFDWSWLSSSYRACPPVLPPSHATE